MNWHLEELSNFWFMINWRQKWINKIIFILCVMGNFFSRLYEIRVIRHLNKNHRYPCWNKVGSRRRKFLFKSIFNHLKVRIIKKKSKWTANYFQPWTFTREKKNLVHFIIEEVKWNKNAISQVSGSFKKWNHSKRTHIISQAVLK